jgi:low affinity Fe/Cu permease
MTRFDRFAAWAADKVATAGFFAFCVVLVVIWLPSIAAIRDVDTWQLIINTATTIITFLLVALLHNDAQRAEKAAAEREEALHRKLDALLANSQQ